MVGGYKAENRSMWPSRRWVGRCVNPLSSHLTACVFCVIKQGRRDEVVVLDEGLERNGLSLTALEALLRLVVMNLA